jgi:hypothetical protein
MEIPRDLRYGVDKDHWGMSFDPENEEHHTEKIVNGYIACMLVCYRTIYKNRKSEDIWQIFHEDFEGFTFDIFKLAHRGAVRELREQLVIQGVWVKGPRGPISYAKNLQDCLEEATPAEWTEEAIKERNRLIQAITTQQQPPTSQSQQLPSPPTVQQTRQIQQSSSSTTTQQTPGLVYPTPTYMQFQVTERGDRSDTPAKLLTDLMKIYSNDDKKYGGEEYNILDVKLQVFYDCCSKIGLPETQYHNAYSVMLKERASNFYYDKLAGRSHDFQTMIDLTKAHFETEENDQKYLSEWRETTLLRMISENPGKSRLECFQLTVDKLKKIQLVNEKGENPQQEYLEQRARGAYIASICQPEASFDLSIAAQHQDPTATDIHTLNKRLEWQMKNMDKGIKYIALDLENTKLFVFVDGSFANNKDLSSQIGYLIILANEIDSMGTDEFAIKGNLIHYSSTKSKRVTRSVLASEIYGMVGGVDMAIAINTTINMITKQLGFVDIPIVVCTDSYSLYECLVKLGTTKEKRLMIDIMALRQSYERREITEVRWIDGKDNPADAMTKSTPNKALEKFIDSNQLSIRVEGWVHRKEDQ